MGPAEILWRVNHILRVHRERLAYLGGYYQWSAANWQRRLCGSLANKPSPDKLAEWWRERIDLREEPPFLLDQETLAKSAELYGQLFPERSAIVAAEADRICRNEFSFLGIEFQARDAIAWQRDPATNVDWPAKFFADIYIPFCEGTTRESLPRDAKYVWELNRHEFLIECGKAYYLTREPRFAAQVFQTISDWCTNNPYLQGINWSGPLEVAVRSLSWLWAYQFCRDWTDLSVASHLDLIKNFYLHGHYLYRHLEVYSSPNNHLVGEATALYLLGSFFPEFDEATAWRTRAWKILEVEPQRQFYADGGSTEQATSYHHYCLGFFLLAVLTRMRQKLPVPVAMLDRLESAFEFSMWMTTPDGTVPRIGDSDDSRSFRFGQITAWDFRDILSIGAVMFRRSDLKAVAGKFSEDALWLLGKLGYTEFTKLDSRAPDEFSNVFAESGYAVLRSGWGAKDDFLCFDCGAIGKDLHLSNIPRFTHGHADLLSFTLYASGEPVLVDSGFYTFSNCPIWHRYCRDTQGHNTVRVKGVSQAKYGPKSTWSCVSSPGPLSLKSRSSFMIAQGSYSSNPNLYQGAVQHHRAILWKQGSYWLIHDFIDGRGTQGVEVFFHFAPGSADILADRSGVEVKVETGMHILLQAATKVDLDIEVRNGEDGAAGGWVATSYGCCKPAPIVRFHGQLDLPVNLMFFLRVSREYRDLVTLSVPSVTCHSSGDGLAEDCLWKIMVGKSIDMYSPYSNDCKANQCALSI